MKKLQYILLVVLIICNLCSCTHKEYLNEIRLTELTEEEKSILNLVGLKSDIKIYSLEVDDTYKSISIWLETYENGELISDKRGMTATINSNEG